MKRRARPLALLLLCALLATGCRSRQSRSTAGAEPANDPACASACAAFVTAACPSDEPTEARQAACVARCAEARQRARRAGCTAEHQAYLACASTARIECRSRTETAASALEHALGVEGCGVGHQNYERCTEHCREQGVVRTGVAELARAGRKLGVRAELVIEGCTEPLPQKAKGSAAGARCTHHSVCAAERCACAPGRPGYFARACVDDRCAAPSEACTLAPEAVGYRPCR